MLGIPSLTHPNIAPEAPPGLLQRLSLAVPAGTPEPSLAVLWLGEIAAALDFAHSRGVAHGSLDPSHILVGPSLHIKVFGFGRTPGATPEADRAALAALAKLWLGPLAGQMTRSGPTAAAMLETLAGQLPPAPSEDERFLAQPALLRRWLPAALVLAAAGTVYFLSRPVPVPVPVPAPAAIPAAEVASAPERVPTPQPVQLPAAPPPAARAPAPNDASSPTLQLYVRRPDEQTLANGAVLKASERPGKGELLCQIGGVLPPSGSLVELRWLRNGELNDVLALRMGNGLPRGVYGNRGDPGHYEVQLYYAGKVRQTVRFEIQ